MIFFFVVDDHSINMLQYQITVRDTARLKLPPALFSLKKNTHPGALCVFHLPFYSSGGVCSCVCGREWVFMQRKQHVC